MRRLLVGYIVQIPKMHGDDASLSFERSQDMALG
jgi:hypothetical protein